jgi:hypothetical protein
MGEGNLAGGRCGEGRGDARGYLNPDTRRAQRSDLFAASTEDKGVAALQADHALALLGLLNEQRLNGFLGHGVVIALLTHVDAPGIAPGQVQDLGTHEAIVNDHVRFPKKPCGAKGEELRVSRAGADEMDHALPGGFRTIQRIEKGAAGAFLIPSEGQIPGGSSKHALPKGAAGLEVPEDALNRAPHFPGEGGQAADARRQKALDGGAKVHGKHGGRASGGNGDHHLASIHKRRGLKIGACRLIHQVHEGAGVPGPACLLTSGGWIGFGDEYEGRAGEVRCLGGLGLAFHPSRKAKRGSPVSSQPFQPRWARKEQAKLRLGHRASAGHHNGFSRKGEGGGEGLHGRDPGLSTRTR